MRTIIAGSRAVGRLSARSWNYEYLKELVSRAVSESDGQSKGTLDTIEKMKRARKKGFVLNVAAQNQKDRPETKTA